MVQGSSGGAGTSSLSDAEVVRRAEQAQGRDARIPGVYTREDADRIGKAWVAADGGIAQVLEKGDITIYISGNGRRQYRTPTYKRDQGRVQANLESRPANSRAWESNAHLDIAEGPPVPPGP